MGRASPVRISSGPMVVQRTADLEVGGSVLGRLAFVGTGAAIGGLGFELPSLPLKKKPNCVFLSACVLARQTV